MAKRISPEWDPPRPADEEFARKVEALVLEADTFARAASDLPTPDTPWHLQGSKCRKPLVKSRVQHKHPCRGCGGHLDLCNPDCANCMSRHSARRKALVA